MITCEGGIKIFFGEVGFESTD